MNREPPPVFRFSHIARAGDNGLLCCFVIGYAAAPDQAWDAVAVNETFLDRWQIELNKARRALRLEEQK